MSLRQGLLEAFLVLLFFVVVPGLLLLMCNPLFVHSVSNLSENLVSVEYFVGGRECDARCVRAELGGGDGLVPAMDLTVIIPAFNEESRLPPMLDSAIPFLNDWSAREKKTYEILVSDDHSLDGTRDYVLGKASTDPLVRLLSLGRNCGKGGAVRRGVQYARGQYILMADADGATEMSDFPKVWEGLQRIQSVDGAGNLGMSVGSRAHMEKQSIATRSWVRTVLMHGFHFLVTILCTKNVRDTQCGFKLFTRKTARILFSNLHLEGWTFDIELIFIAEKLGIPISEIAVTWHEVSGSKLIQSKMDIVVTSLKMARDMLCLRIAYLAGIWKIQPNLV